jgi:branched-chain amino acid transport system substrate-binding protein
MKKRTAIIISGLVVLAAIGVVVWRKAHSRAVAIGAVLPLSGSSAQYGRFVKDGFDLAIEEINKKAGNEGITLRVIYEDDQAVPGQAASAMTKLVKADDVPIVFGSWASSCVLAQAPIAEKEKVPILAEAQSPQIRDAGDYVFRIQPDSRYYLNVLAPYVCKDLNLKRIAILYVNNDYGKDQANVFRDLAQKLGSQIVFEEGFSQGTQDFRTVLTKMKESTPDGVFIPVYAEAGPILKQAYELGIKSKFFGSAPLENPDVLATAGEGAEGVIYVHHFDPDSDEPQVKQFIQNFKMKYGRAPEGYAALAYDGAYVIDHVLTICGSSRVCIKNELYKIKDFPGVAGPTTFDDHGDVIKPIVIRSVKNDQFVTIKP